MITYFLYMLVAMAILWIFFVNIMWLKHNKEKVPLWLHKPLMGVVIIGGIWDGLFNIIFGTVLLIGWPDFKGAKWHFPLLTHRLRGIIRANKQDTILDRYRFYLSRFICRYLVAPWDKNHCGLENIGQNV
jgi:hypothetical protein